MGEKIEENKRKPQESSSELIRRQLNEERLEYMKRWLEMTDEEKMKEAERKSKQTEEVAKRVGAKVKEVKIKTGGEKNEK